MTDIMKLATDYAQACYNLANPDSYDAERAEEARAALQSAIEALQDKLDSSVHGHNQIFELSKILQAERDQLQAEVERMTVERDVNKRMRDLHFAEKNALQSQLDAMGKGEPTYRCVPYSNVPGALVSEPVDYYAAPKALAPTAFQRYEPEIWREDRIRMEPDSLGDWVKWSDVNAAIGGAP